MALYHPAYFSGHHSIFNTYFVHYTNFFDTTYLFGGAVTPISAEDAASSLHHYPINPEQQRE